MTAVRTPMPAGASAEALPGPTPRRVRPPRWLDLRLVLGVLLVLGSVLLGARVVGAADATVPVWAAAGDLAAGTELTRGRPACRSTSGWTTPPTPTCPRAPAPRAHAVPRRAGRRAAAAVGAGRRPPSSCSWRCPVQAGYVPPGLERGQLVDVYAVADPAAGATGRRRRA